MPITDLHFLSQLNGRPFLSGVAEGCVYVPEGVEADSDLGFLIGLFTH